MILLLFTLAANCGACHEKQYAEWRSSRHSVAFTNRIFAASYAREPMRWCLSCHAPSPEQQRAIGEARRVEEVSAPEVADGVSCIACHVRDGRVLTKRELGAPEFCASCHQFNFPHQTEPMQDTVAEWRRAGGQERCQDCHMPRGAHTFPGAHDRSFLARAVEVNVSGSDDGVVVRLQARGAAHRVPTGDPFRRLIVQLCGEPSCDEPDASPSFGRVFAREGEGWRLVADESLPAGGSRTRAVKLDRARPIYWRLLYGYAASSSAPSLDGEDWSSELQRGVVR